MQEVLTPAARKPREPRNGVNTPVLMATINAVKDTPALAQFRFRASNRWSDGTYSETRIESFSGAGGEHKHTTEFRYGADHPAVLVGGDRAPTPVEFLLHGLVACITAGIGNIAAARGVTLTSVESRSKATSTCAAFSGSRMGSATATSAFASRSTSRAMRRRRNCARSSSSRAPAPRFTTC